MTRRTLLCSLFGTVAAAAPYPCIVEPRWLEVTHHRVDVSKTPVSEAIRILHLSDLHASLFVPLPMIEHAISVGLAEKPDLVVLTGDFITDRRGFDNQRYAAALKRISDAVPAFAVLGNHDGGSWARYFHGYSDHRIVDHILEESGIELLHNRSRQVRVRDRQISLVGVGDLWANEIDGRRAFSGLDRRNPTILLAHNPDSKSVLRTFSWDLMLSGHTHGGQVIVPFSGESWVPVRDKRYIAGLKPWGTRQIFVTRGVGNVGGVRFRCRPEASVLDVC